jgi:chemotaxis protein CheD
MADMKALKSKGDVLVTYSLGSCIAVVATDPTAGVGGLLHFMLPESKLDSGKAAQRPCMFADTGIGALLEELERLGARRRLIAVKLVGGAQVLDKANFFGIGQRNYTAARRLLWKQGLLIEAEDVGGTDIRTVELELATGRVNVKVNGNSRLRAL